MIFLKKILNYVRIAGKQPAGAFLYIVCTLMSVMFGEERSARWKASTDDFHFELILDESKNNKGNLANKKKKEKKESRI